MFGALRMHTEKRNWVSIQKQKGRETRLYRHPRFIKKIFLCTMAIYVLQFFNPYIHLFFFIFCLHLFLMLIFNLIYYVISWRYLLSLFHKVKNFTCFSSNFPPVFHSSGLLILLLSLVFLDLFQIFIFVLNCNCMFGMKSMCSSSYWIF